MRLIYILKNTWNTFAKAGNHTWGGRKLEGRGKETGDRRKESGVRSRKLGVRGSKVWAGNMLTTGATIRFEAAGSTNAYAVEHRNLRRSPRH